jgi:2-dehydro-3-deoxygluconokinase
VAGVDVTSFGEGQLRLTTGLGHSLGEARSLEVFVAGAEANVLGLLSRLGRRTSMVTAVPDSPLGRRITEELRAAGVGLDGLVVRPEGRVALYFVEENAAPIPSRVLYDRADSVFATLSPDDVDHELLASSRLVLLTGITAALTDRTRAVLERTLATAASAGQQVCFDINFRRKLWSPETAQAWFGQALTGRVTVLSCARRDADTLFAIAGPARDVPARLAERFGAPTVLVSDGPGTIHCHHDGTTYARDPVPDTTVVDRVGAGDALLGGFLHGYLDGDVERGLRLGVTAAAMTLGRRGEQLRTSAAELDLLAADVSNGDIDR